MSLEIVCACGRHLRASEQHVGRRIKCPGCGASHIVPEPGASVAVTSSRRPSGPSRWPTLLLLLLAAPGILGALVGGWWYLTHPRGANSTDLSEELLIPQEVQGFLRLRLAEMWATPAIREALEKARADNPEVDDPIAFLERQTSLRPEQVERLTFVFIDLAARLGWTMFRTREPYDRQQVLARLFAVSERVHEGQIYYVGDDSDGRPLAICPLAPRLLIAGPEEGVRRCLALLRDPATNGEGPMAPLIARLDDPAQVFGGFKPEPSSLGTLRSIPSLSVLADVKQVEVSAQVEEPTRILAQTQADDAEQAGRMNDSLRNSMKMLRGVLLLQALEGGDRAVAIQRIGKLLNQTEIRAEGRSVRMTLTTDPETLVAILPALPRLLSGE